MGFDNKKINDTSNEITFNPNDPRMVEHLYNQMLNLSMQVMTLTSFVSHLMKEHGISFSDQEKIFSELNKDNFNELLENDPMFDTWWKSKLSKEIGGIPGLQL